MVRANRKSPSLNQGATFSPLKKIATGVHGLDTVLPGVLPAGRNTIRCGGRRIGKSVFALESLHTGMLVGEPEILVTLGEKYGGGTPTPGWGPAALEGSDHHRLVLPGIKDEGKAPDMTPAKKPPENGGGPKELRLILFVAGSEPNSVLARQNLERLCMEHYPDCHAIEVVDVFRNIDVAVKHNIIITPTLIKVAPDPTVIVFGNLSDSRKVMASLQLEE